MQRGRAVKRVLVCFFICDNDLWGKPEANIRVFYILNEPEKQGDINDSKSNTLNSRGTPYDSNGEREGLLRGGNSSERKSGKPADKPGSVRGLAARTQAPRACAGPLGP